MDGPHLDKTGIGARTYTGAGVWIHADLMPGNLITRGGRLAGVIDLGAACIGHGRGRHAQLEPNCPRSRDTYRCTLGVDDGSEVADRPSKRSLPCRTTSTPTQSWPPRPATP